MFAVIIAWKNYWSMRIMIVLILLYYGSISAVLEGDHVWSIEHTFVPQAAAISNSSLTTVQFNVGQTAFLPCKFSHYSRHHENGVTWFRRRDWQILSAGKYINTNDDRFAILHQDGSADWTLQLKYARINDSDTYECQVHTGSGFLSHYVKLIIIQPSAVILEAEELHVRTRDTFKITCLIEKILTEPKYIMWLHRGDTLNYAPDRPRHTIELNPQGIHTTSTLTISNAGYGDSGNYSCSAPNTLTASIYVYVTEGDTVAAVHNRNANSGMQFSTFSLFSISCTCINFFLSRKLSSYDFPSLQPSL